MPLVYRTPLPQPRPPLRPHLQNQNQHQHQHPSSPSHSVTAHSPVELLWLLPLASQTCHCPRSRLPLSSTNSPASFKCLQATRASSTLVLPRQRPQRLLCKLVVSFLQGLGGHRVALACPRHSSLEPLRQLRPSLLHLVPRRPLLPALPQLLRPRRAWLKN